MFVANPGWTNQQIAGQLVKDPEPVKKGLSALYRKFDVSGRAALLDALKQRGMA